MITKVISGGQTGVDRAALDAAIDKGIEHGGYCPKGRLAEDGRIPDKYNLTELATSSYSARTRRNIQESDGTLIVTLSHLRTPGTELTAKIAHQSQKPLLYCTYSWEYGNDSIRNAVQFREWVKHFDIKTLNVAGPRASKSPRIYGDALMQICVMLGLANEEEESNHPPQTKGEME